MAELAMVALIGGTVLSTIGQIQQGRAAAAAGKAEQTALEHQAKIQERQAEALAQEAGQERARSQRAAEEERRQGKFIASRARALGAASGAVFDPAILGSLDFETDYRVLSQLYSGEESARGLQYRGALARAGAAGDVYAGSVAAAAGKSARQRSYLSAAGALLSGGSALYDKYSDLPSDSGSPELSAMGRRRYY